MNKESESTVREWLNEYKSLAEASIAGYASQILNNEDVLNALMDVFRVYTNSGGSDSATNSLLQPVCHQLFEFYRSGHKELKYFTINLFPSIILSHVIISSGTIEPTATDTLILSIYSLENTAINEDKDSPGIEIPQLQYPSIYHDPMSGVFSEQTVKDRNTGRRYYHKPRLPDYKVILPYNRFQILTRVMTVYCDHIAVLKKTSHLSLCAACTFLASCGYLWQNKFLPDKGSKGYIRPIPRRIPLGVDFILAVVQGVYFAMYNNCHKEALAAVESMDTRVSCELVPQAMFLCNAILDTAKMEAEERKKADHVVEGEEEVPFGLSGIHLTPMLTRENSRRGKSRNAATAKSIRDHKWSHRSEEISGDLSRSLQNPEINVHPPKPPTISESEESGKAERHTTSPSKLLKSKLKKSVPTGSPLSGTTEKLKSPAPSAEKKNKKLQTDKSLEDSDNSPNLKRTPSKKSPQLSKRSSKTALQKQHSLDDGSVHSTATKSKMPVSKSTNDSIAPIITGKNISVSLETSFKSNDQSSTKHSASSSALLDVTKQLDTSTESESHDISVDERSKETYPLLPTSEQATKNHHGGTQQTVL